MNLNIRTRLTLKFMMVVAGLTLLSMFFIYFRFERQLLDEFYMGLRSKGLMSAEMLLRHIPEGQWSEQNPTKSSTRLPVKENLYVYDLQGHQIYALHNDKPPFDREWLKGVNRKGECKWDAGKYKYLGLRYTTTQENENYLIVSSSVFDKTNLVNLQRILLIAFLLVSLLVAVAGWLFAGQALDPVRKVMNQVDAILPSKLGQRIQSSSRQDEISRLVDTFNNMLDRIERSFQLQKSFLSNVSHELKNPLSIIYTQVDVGLQKSRSQAEYHEILESLREDILELNETVERLMHLARLTAEDVAIPMQAVFMDELLWQIKAVFERKYPHYKMDLKIKSFPDEHESLTIWANETLLKAALLNIAENSCKYSDGSVTVELDNWSDHTITLIIKDKGRGISAADLPHVFEPFYRGKGKEGKKGAGVGLALVDSVLKLHQVQCHVSSKEGQGTAFQLVFPIHFTSIVREPSFLIKN